MNKLHTLNSETKNLLQQLGVLLATTVQYTNLPAIYAGYQQHIQVIKHVKGDAGFDILNYTKDFLEDVQDMVDIEEAMDVVFEGFLKEASIVPCEKSELKSFFQLMYERLNASIKE